MDLVALIQDPEAQAAVGSFLVVAGILVPIARKLAAKTRNTIDDKIVDMIDTVLAFIPHIKIGK